MPLGTTMNNDDAYRAEYDRYYDAADRIPGRTPMTFDEWKRANGHSTNIKGQHFKGPCNVTACQKPGATYWNTSTLAFYCRDCARKINEYAPGAPLCIDSDCMPGFSQMTDRDAMLKKLADALCANDGNYDRMAAAALQVMEGR